MTVLASTLGVLGTACLIVAVTADAFYAPRGQELKVSSR